MDGARWSLHKIRTNNTTHHRSPWQNNNKLKGIYVSWMKRHICLYLFYREYKLFSYRFSVSHNLRQWRRFNLKTIGFLKAISDTRDHGATHLGPICLCTCFICHGERISMPLVSFRCHMYSVCWWYYPWSVRHVITVSHVHYWNLTTFMPSNDKLSVSYFPIHAKNGDLNQITCHC